MSKAALHAKPFRRTDSNSREDRLIQESFPVDPGASNPYSNDAVRYNKYGVIQRDVIEWNWMGYGVVSHDNERCSVV